MIRKWAMRWSLMALAVVLVSGVWAQPPGRPGGMRDNPKRDLSRFIMGVGLLEKNGKAKLSAPQAKKIVDIIAPWRKKSSMNEAQAKDLNKKLRAVLTPVQAKELQKLRPPRREGQRRGERREGNRRGGERGGGHRGEGGPGQDRRKQMEKGQAFFKTNNPFYPPTGNAAAKQLPPQFQEGLKRRYDANIAVLTQLSKKAGRR